MGNGVEISNGGGAIDEDLVARDLEDGAVAVVEVVEKSRAS